MISEPYRACVISYHRPPGCVGSWLHTAQGYESTGLSAHACLLDLKNTLNHDYIHWQLLRATDPQSTSGEGYPQVQPHPSIRGLLRHDQFEELAGTIEILKGAVPRRWQMGPFQLDTVPNRPKSLPPTFQFDPFMVRQASAPFPILVKTRVVLKNGLPFYLGLGKDGPEHLVLLAMTFYAVENDQL
ncbi:MAG: hypothetical protein H6510_17940 [Acidobacteria bacterium]|nr:hypothetical protein [Acidobacteriota bacterium]MCB9399699.1 hypothetical protein [Acidobacteriota bacterium]